MTTISLVPNPEQKLRLERAETALMEYTKGKPSGPLRNTVWRGDGYVELYCFNNRLHLAAIFVMPENRRTGLGTQYLTELLAIADKNGAELECSVVPFGAADSGVKMGVAALTKWYRKHGFSPAPKRKNLLIRQAQQSPSEH